jgi:TetR/AcrR family transcriptional repressor of nem operon
MRRSREDAAQTRRTIVEAASRLFRERGIAATSVADVMESVGLTVGGFYRHFESKDALVAEAIDHASTERTRIELARYLSQAHRMNPGVGCPVAALCSEVAHEGRPAKKAFTRALQRLLDGVSAAFPEGSKLRADVLHAASSAVGALVLARATSDDALANDLLAATREKLLEEGSRRNVRPRKRGRTR